MKSEIKNYIIGKEVYHITKGQGIVEKYEEWNNGNSYIYVNFIKTNKTIMMAYPKAFEEHLIISGKESNKIINTDLLANTKPVSNAQSTNQKETIKSGWRRDNCAGYELVNYLLKTNYTFGRTSIWKVTKNIYIWLPRIDGKERNGWCNYFENGNTNTIIEKNMNNLYSPTGLDHPYRWVFDRKDNGFIFMGVYKLREPESTNMKRILDKVNDAIKI